MIDFRLRFHLHRYKAKVEGEPPPELWTPEELAALHRHTTLTDLKATDGYTSGGGDVAALLAEAPSVAASLQLDGTTIGLEALESLHARLQDIQRSMVAPAPQLHNECVNVHVPGLGLLVINEVCVEYDCCTEKLQRLLTEGWRIVAACPQPDKRRPDYILGRTVAP